MWGIVVRALVAAAGSETVRGLVVSLVKKKLAKQQQKIDKHVESLAKAAGMTPEELRARVQAELGNPAGQNAKELDRAKAGSLGIRGK